MFWCASQEEMCVLKKCKQRQESIEMKGLKASFFCLWIQFIMSMQEKQVKFGNIFMNINLFLIYFVIICFFC